MNARDLMFVDIDREGAAAPAGIAQDIAQELVSSVFSLFGKAKPPAPPPPAPAADAVVNGIQRVAERHNLSARVYKTAAGYRVLIVNARFEPGSGESEALLREFESDALYIRLCKMQESFRARLTPKPWRCNLPQPPVSFPFEGEKEEARFYGWVAKYTAACQGYATCRLVGSFGGGAMEPAFQELVAYHDQETKANSGLPLA
jgi:hypothetical protein